MANKRINKSEAVYDHDCFDNYFYSDPEKENSWALNDLCATIDDCHLEHTGEVDNQDYVECCTTLPDGTEVAVSVGICDDGTGDNDLHELASYNIDVGDNVGPGVIREWDKAYKIDEIPEMWQDLWDDLDKLIAEHSANESLNKGKTMKSESIEDLKDKSVSWGTMRSEDLIPKFLGVLKQYAPDNYDAYVKANPEVLDLKGMDDETLGWVVDELFDELDKIAPEGTYFGAHPDDGADYGFWSVEESKQREAKKSEAYEDIWRGAQVVSYEDAADYITLPAEEEQKIIDKYGEDYYDNPDAMNEYAEALDDYIVSMFDQDFVYIDGDEIPLAVCREPKVLIVQDIDHIDGDKAVELVKKLANGELTGSSEDGDFVAIMDGVNGSPHFDIYSEEPKSEGKSDKDGKDDKDCKGKGCDGSDEKCGGDKKKENRGKPQEGPGAGYTVTIKDMTISDEPKISKDGDTFIVEAPVEYEANAEGYDWGSAYIMNELVGTDEGTFPHNPFKGVLTMEVKDSPDIWGVMNDKFFDDVDNPTDEEKISVLKDRFYKGATFNDFEQNYGGGYSHSKFVSEDDVCMQADWDGFNDIEFGGAADGYASGTLTIDDRFVEDIEFASDYGYNRYKLVEAIQQFVKGRGLEMDWSEDTLYDYVAPYVTSDEITDDYVKEILSDMVDSGVEFTDADGNPADLQLESIQGESKKSESTPHDAYYAKALQAVDRAIKMTHDQFDITGDVAKFDADLKKYLVSYVDSLNDTRLAGIGLLGDLRGRIKDFARGDREEWWKNRKQGESKKSESLTLKQKELKDMVRYGKAEDITTLPDEEAKELRKKGIETVGVSRGTYGMNGALLRDKDGNLYAITARSTNLFYFV